MEDFVCATFYCLHAAPADGNQHICVREKMTRVLLNSVIYTISVL